MNSQLRPAIVAVALGLLAVCVFGLRLACTPADLSAVHRNEELEQLRQATFRRVEVRQRVVRELIDRRRTLAEALERFEELDREWPDFSQQVSEERAGRTQEEWAYQHILAIIEEILRDRPEEAAAVLRRLEKDYRQLHADRQAPSTGAMERTERRPIGACIPSPAWSCAGEAAKRLRSPIRTTARLQTAPSWMCCRNPEGGRRGTSPTRAGVVYLPCLVRLTGLRSTLP